MGRITIFTQETCLFSRQVKHELDRRGLPYREISLTEFPDRRADIFVITRSMATPQVFFNTRHVGGCDATIKLLETWDKDPQFETALDKFNTQIGQFPDPSSPHLAIPTTPTATQDSPANVRDQPTRKTIQLQLSNGTTRTYGIWELTQVLCNILPVANLNYHLMTYKQSIRGDKAISALVGHFECSTRQQAEAIGKQLQEAQLLHHVTYDHDFMDTPKYFYRLQCHQTPHILNSLYLVDADGDDEVDFYNGDDCVEKAEALVKRVEHLLYQVERDCQALPKKGKILYQQAKNHPRWGELNEVLCEFQSVNIDSMPPKTWLAFGLNVYNIMFKFALMKVGIPTTEANQQAFLHRIQFNVAGELYNFHEWLAAISGGNVGEQRTSICSTRSSLIVPNRPNPSTTCQKKRDSVLKDTIGGDDGSERSDSSTSRGSFTSPATLNGSFQNFRRPSITTRRSGTGTSTSSSTNSDQKELLATADYRLYFATHTLWNRATAIPHFTAQSVEKELTVAALAFCENDSNVLIDTQRSQMHVSGVFSLFSRHSGDNNNKELTNIIFNYLESPKKLQLQQLLYSGAKQKLKITFHSDDWTTNAVRKGYDEFKTASIDANCARF